MVKQSTTINTRTQYTIEYDDECDYFTVSWEDDEELTWIDNENKEYIIDMEEELHGNIGSKFNNTWIEHIKLHFNWKKGEVIYLNTKCNCDNCFYVMRGWGDAGEREEDKKNADYIIDEYGYVSKRFFQNYMMDTNSGVVPNAFYYRIDCIYNDDWCI
jgi:hypothetical protein